MSLGVLLLYAIISYTGLIFLRIVLGFIRAQPAPWLRPSINFVYDATEPFLRIFRGLLPPLSVGGMGLDLSPILAFIALQILGAIVANTIR